MSYTNTVALKLPDQLLVRYFRAGELDTVRDVILKDETVTVHLPERIDHWRDLGGGLGYVPDEELSSPAK